MRQSAGHGTLTVEMSEPIRTGNELVLYRLDQLERRMSEDSKALWDRLDAHFSHAEAQRSEAAKTAMDLQLRVDRLEQSRKAQSRVLGAVVTALGAAGIKIAADLAGMLGG